MQKKYLQEAEKYAKQNQRRRIWRKIVRVMACVVVFCTTYALILPAITQEKTQCGLSEHTHSESCYKKIEAESVAVLACTYESLGVHVHTSECYDSGNHLICGQADFVVHVHDGACVDASGVLACRIPEIPEHEHTDSCYAIEKAELTHVHEDACYGTERGELICKTAETDGHTHGESCFTQGELVCQIPEQEGHTHGEECSETVLVCSLEVEPHVHGEGCYQQKVCELSEDETHTHSEECCGSILVCDLTEQPHTHTDGCYETHFLCDLPETEGHTHGTDCYESIMTCELSEEPAHQHTDECYEMVSVLVCGLEEGTASAAEAETQESVEPELICGKQEIRLHCHDSVLCYAGSAEEGSLICTELAVSEHVHDESCYVTEEVALTDVDTLTCTLMEGHVHAEECYDEAGTLICTETENHVHGDMCYGTWVLSCELPEHTHTQTCYPETEYQCGLDSHTHTDTCFDSEENLICALTEHIHTEACIQSETLPMILMSESGGNGELKIKLFYDSADEENTNYPDGVSFYTESNMAGYLKIYPENMTESEMPQNVTVTLKLPKIYLEKNSVKIPEFISQSPHTISEVAEEGEYYVVSVHFDSYLQMEVVTLPFTMSFLDRETPDNYKLPVHATITYDGFEGSQTENLIYKPLYDPWEIVKYVNSNQIPAFAEDGASALVTANEPDGNPYLGDDTYAAFQFLINGVTSAGSYVTDINNRRNLCEITITDTLPTYEHVDGTTRIAVFDAEKNPGWVLSEDGITVSKTYSGNKTRECTDQITADTLYLRFPGAKMEIKTVEKGGTILTYQDVELDNAVSMVGTPSNMAEGETKPSDDDTLRFYMSTLVPADGNFTKSNGITEIYDGYSYKANEFQWNLVLSNPTAQDFCNVVIHDNSIVAEDPENTDPSLDERLKFVRLESGACMFQDSSLTLREVIDYVLFYTDSGETVTYTVDQLDWHNSSYFELIPDESKVFTAFEIYCKDSYQMKMHEILAFSAYTVFKDPNASHYDEADNSNNFFPNRATATYTYPVSNTTMMAWLTSQSQFHINPSSEDVAVEKEDYYWFFIDSYNVGDKVLFVVYPTGKLDDSKVYGDVQLVDLLPPGTSYVQGSWYYNPTYNTPNKTDYPFIDFVTGVEVQENYHNSGRTALIFHMDGNLLREKMAQWPGERYPVELYFQVRVEPDITSGQHFNHVYLVGDNLDTYKKEINYELDVYDLNNNGVTDEKIAHAQAPFTVKAAKAMYSEKFIKHANAASWTKQTLKLQVGSEFDYLLKMTNATDTARAGLVMFDTLPRIGDQNIFQSGARNSEFTVQLRDAITPPEGYQVYYTTNTGVYGMTMDTAVKDDSLWTQEIADYAQVTAFKIVANEGTVVASSASVSVQVPAKVVDVLDDASMALLHSKAPEEHDTGTVTSLIATNTFGYWTSDSTEAKESNPVSVRINFAGFRVKKVDSESGNGLLGAEFELKDLRGNVLQTVTSDELGIVQFNDLPAGTYILTETKAPAGYYTPNVSMRVKIEFNALTMDYTVTFTGDYQGSGSVSDPLIVKNRSGVELPNTGGAGTTTYTMAGLVLMLFSMAYLLYRPKARRREEF